MNKRRSRSEIDFCSIIAACPVCGGKLQTAAADVLLCVNCPQRYVLQEGIWQFLSFDQQHQYQTFLNAYRQIRQHEGWKRVDPAFYLKLPDVTATDPLAWVWRIRKRSLRIMEKYLTHGSGAWAVDLGAGNGWLSRYLSQHGYSVITADIHEDEWDGLKGGQLYLDQGVSFVRILASMEHRLPIQDESITLAVLNAALHYVDPFTTLTHIYRILKNDGLLIILDSPTYTKGESGEKMMQERWKSLQTTYGIADLSIQGRGYLVRSEIVGQLRAIGFIVNMVWPDNIIKRQFQSLRQRITDTREHARFPLFICRKFKSDS